MPNNLLITSALLLLLMISTQLSCAAEHEDVNSMSRGEATITPVDKSSDRRLADARPTPITDEWDNNIDNANIPASLQPNSNIRVGGFIAAEAVYRNRSEMSDISSATANIPFPNKANYNFSEFRASARQSRLSVLAQRAQNDYTTLSAYYEIDFVGASSTSNMQQSNSYQPRMRHLYTTIDWRDLGIHLLAGHSWSLATMHNQGIIPRSEWTPLRIDSAYVPGFTWARQSQLRLAKDWRDRYWAALSLENPQTTYSTNGTMPGNLYSIFPASNLNSSTSASISTRPDLIIKFAIDSGFGHYEAYGLNREYVWTSADGTGAKSTTSNAIGAGMILPLIPATLDADLSVLSGSGIGRYGSAQLADVTFDSNGSIAPLHERQLLAGLVWHADKAWDMYFYAGEERASQQFSSANGLSYGYGNPAISNAGCITPGGICNASIKKVGQVTFGFWWKLYQNGANQMQFGVQYSHTTVAAFADSTGLAPNTNNNMLFTSLRYYPF